MDFTGYDKIPASTTRWEADEATMRRLAKLRWCVTEKIHGASFCFVLSDGPIQCASRRRLLAPEESFFGHRRVLARLTDHLTDLRRRLSAAHPVAERFLVYGELYGGEYPHPEVAPVPGVQAIQTGVWYSPDVHFSAFDVARVCDGERSWLSVEDAMAHLDAAGVPFCPPLLIGALGDAMALSLERQTAIPQTHRLPVLADNLAEGVVVKPLTDALIETARGTIRPVIKRKHPRFDEDDRFHAAARWRPAAPEVSALDALEWAFLRRINENRLASARSKLGPQAAAAAMCDEVCADIWVDVTEEHPGLVAGLSGEDRALLDAVGREEVERLLSAG